jgi:hypothetical protein
MMQTKCLIIASLCLIENIAKIILSELILTWQSRYSTCSDEITLCWTEKLYAFVGFIGFLCSLKLLVGVKTKSARDVRYWIVFQWCSLIHQIYMSVVINEFIIKSDELQQYASISSIVIFIYTLLELYFLITIMILFVTHRQLECVSDFADPEQQLTQFHAIDCPPSYDEAVKTSRVIIKR